MQDIVDVAAEVMQENSISVAMSAETITRLRKATLSESRKKLAFIYSTVFAELGARGPVRQMWSISDPRREESRQNPARMAGCRAGSQAQGHGADGS